MLHTHDDFLSAIEANPADRTLRLVFADWLDEQSDPPPHPADCAGSSIGAGRGAQLAELVRIEEEMRALPVFSDRFWELKPRRNALREQAGTEWCARMRYGTECEPVFRHGIPDGWLQRWRLIREFTERWHRVPMPDVGGRQKEIAEAEARLGRTLPPSVREWVAFGQDVQSDKSDSVFAHVVDVGESLSEEGVMLHGRGSGSLGYFFEVRFDDFAQPDPPVKLFADFGTDDDPAEATNRVWGDYPVTQLALWFVTTIPSSATHVQFRLPEPDLSRVRAEIEGAFPITVRWGHLSLHEADGILVAFGWPLCGSEPAVWVKRAPNIAIESLPTVLHAAIRDVIPF